MKVAIVGSRGFKQLEKVIEYVNSLSDGDVVVSGHAVGVDITAEQAAHMRGLKVETFLPDWNTFGRSAGFRRNVQIVDAADRVVAFWDGRSRGTQHSIDLGYKANKDVRIIYESERPALLPEHEESVRIKSDISSSRGAGRRGNIDL